MRQLIESVWESIKKAQQLYSDKQHVNFDVSDIKKDSFSKKFQEAYDVMKKKYMSKDVVALDRHKVAALIICTIVDEEIVTYTKNLDPNYIFLGNEMVALSVGLSYMQRSLNDRLQELSINKKINGYHMPTAMACKTDYFDIFARNLYFSKTNYVLNPLDIADKLFLIEYLTLKNEMIEPNLLIDSQQP